MEYWQALHLCDTEDLVELAVAAEEFGYTGVALGDHLLMPTDFAAAYPYSADGKVEIDVQVPFPDPFVAFAAMASRTTTLNFTTWVFVLPLRDPFTVAKSVATLDRISHQRFTFGVGVGWMAEEFEAAGIPFKHRGRRTDEMIEALELLWTGEPVTYDGKDISFHDVCVQPAPGRRIPILVGGHTEVALARAARHDGWFALPIPVAEVRRRVDRLRELRAEAQVSDKPYTTMVMVPWGVSAEEHAELASMDIDSIAFIPPDPSLPLAERIAGMEQAIRPFQG